MVRGQASGQGGGVGILVGGNSRAFDAMRDAGIAATTFRAYRDRYNEIPAQWPAKPEAPGAQVTLSIRPLPDDLLAGRLDDPLRNLIAAAPPGSRLSAWHEASNLDAYPDWVTAGRIAPVHQYLQELCRGSNVGYGSIICAPPSQVRAWMGTGLDWYGLDIYDFRDGQFRAPLTGRISRRRLFARLDDMLATCRGLAGRDHPDIDICETNSPRPRHRPQWFELLAEWLAANGGHRMQTFWKPGGTEGGSWLPEDRETITTLRDLAGPCGG